MALQLGDDAVVAEAGGAAMDQGLGKSCLGQQVGRFQRIEQGLDIIALLRIAGQLARQLQPAVLARRQIAQCAPLQAEFGCGHDALEKWK